MHPSRQGEARCDLRKKRETKKEREERLERERLEEEERARVIREREEAFRAERDRIHQEAEAARQKREEEKRAKEKELDDKIGLLQTELTALERTLLEANCTFECMKIDFSVCVAARAAGMGSGGLTADEVKTAAREVYKLQLLIMQRKVEHDLFVKERNKLAGWEKYSPWILGGVAVLALGAYYWLHMLQGKKE